MNKYEVMFIVKPAEEEATNAVIEKVEALIARVGGTVEKVDRWGKRRLAYAVKKFTDGFYVLINFENTDPHEAARIVDFVSGATFALDGKLEKVGKDIFMCVPVNISIDYSDNDSNKTEQNEYAWDNK